ncbi:MAG TPA: hypothetical protein VK596_09615 [Edaphobacter sp.]|nr:hypothetical protein [Edaphobacter sp.]
MIRQAINCDICGVERLEPTSHWFVADEMGGELRLRAWEAPKSSRKNAKHLCGQKCAQRLMDNFTASIMTELQTSKNAKEAVAEIRKGSAVNSAPVADCDDAPILERLGYDRETAAAIEAESWAGPVRPKETWGAEVRTRNESLIPAARVKSSQGVRPFQRPA